MTHGRLDRTVRPADADRLFAAAGEPKEMRWWNAGHILPAEAIEEARYRVLAVDYRVLGLPVADGGTWSNQWIFDRQSPDQTRRQWRTPSLGSP